MVQYLDFIILVNVMVGHPIMLFSGLSLPFSFWVISPNPICLAKSSVTCGKYSLTPR